MKGTSLTATIPGAQQGKDFKTAFSLASGWERHSLWLSGSDSVAVSHANLQLSVTLNQLHLVAFLIQLSLLCGWLPLIHSLSSFQTFVDNILLAPLFPFPLSLWNFMRAEIKHIETTVCYHAHSVFNSLKCLLPLPHYWKYSFQGHLMNNLLLNYNRHFFVLSYCFILLGLLAFVPTDHFYLKFLCP